MHTSDHAVAWCFLLILVMKPHAALCPFNLWPGPIVCGCVCVQNTISLCMTERGERVWSWCAKGSRALYDICGSKGSLLGYHFSCVDNGAVECEETGVTEMPDLPPSPPANPLSCCLLPSIQAPVFSLAHALSPLLFFLSFHCLSWGATRSRSRHTHPLCLPIISVWARTSPCWPTVQYKAYSIANVPECFCGV